MGREVGIGLLYALALQVSLLQAYTQLLDGSQDVNLDFDQLMLQDTVAHSQ